MISVEGFFDMHIHSAPAPFQRIGDSVDIARWCAAGGLAGIVIKSHFESTISKAHHARREVAREFPDFHIFAGIALNRGVGGLNPGAVEIALDQGARIVWLPTFDAANHARAFGSIGTYGFKNLTLPFQRSAAYAGYTLLESGRLTQAAKDVIDIVADYNAVLATGHMSREEIFAAVEYGRARKVSRIVITHPEYYVPNLEDVDIATLAHEGAFMEFCAVSCGPMTPAASIERVKQMIDVVSPERAVIASDTGQPFSPRPPEALRVFAQCLFERGISQSAIRRMAIDNPKHLLGLN
jgi:2-keto-3-deoxy-6-phosphogluconate aldolase